MFLLCSNSPLSQGTRPPRAGLLGVALRVALGAAPEPNLRSVSALRAKHKGAVAAISRLLQPRRTTMSQSNLPAPVSPLHHRLIDDMGMRTTWTCGRHGYADDMDTRTTWIWGRLGYGDDLDMPTTWTCAGFHPTHSATRSAISAASPRSWTERPTPRAPPPAPVSCRATGG